MTSNNTHTPSSRRDFFQKSAVLLGAGAVVARLTAQPIPGSNTVTDLDVLNYALALENLEAAFYTQGLGRFGATDFNNSSSSQVFGSKIRNNLLSYLQAIRDHEQAHVQALSTVIRSLGGTPAPACNYRFAYNTADDFLMIAMMLENTGVSAYDGAIGLLKNPDIIKASATIATVEARHAAYLNLLNGAIPFPTAFDPPKTIQEVLAIVSQFIVSCAVPPGSSASPNAPRLVITPVTLTTRSNQVDLDASASADVLGAAVQFLLTQVSGPAASIIGATSSRPTVNLGGGAGVYVFQEKITDRAGNSSQQNVTITYTP